MKGIWIRIVLTVSIVTISLGQSTVIPIEDERLTVHTLVREDVFAGLLSNDLTRMERAERNLETLLARRPSERHLVLVWKASTRLFRAVTALEARQAGTFEEKYREALDLFEQARRIRYDGGVAAVAGGTYTLLADRLPADRRAAAWAAAWDHYSMLWKEQQAGLDGLPVHYRGELLAGLAESAQRTGRLQESGEFVNRILVHMRGTPYEAPAQRWKTDPGSAAATKLSCQNCHDPGRLSARMDSLGRR